MMPVAAWPALFVVSRELSGSEGEMSTGCRSGDLWLRPRVLPLRARGSKALGPDSLWAVPRGGQECGRALDERGRATRVARRRKRRGPGGRREEHQVEAARRSWPVGWRGTRVGEGHAHAVPAHPVQFVALPDRV